MAFCNECGANVGDSRFCNNCGAQVASANAPSAAQPSDNTCIRCGANLQNGTCLSCGWSAPTPSQPMQPVIPLQQQVAPVAPQVQAAPVNVTVNAGAMGNAPSGPPCPKCKSTRTELGGVKSKKLSGGKIAAGVMTGGLSLLATGVSNKQKVDWVCTVCGHSFTIKSK